MLESLRGARRTMEIKLKPSKSGLIVRDPVSKKTLADEGEVKQLSSFWQRRINDGDVVVVGESKSEPKKEIKKD